MNSNSITDIIYPHDFPPKIEPQLLFTHNHDQEKAGKKPRYSGTFNALATIARTESLGSLWTGFPPYLLAKGTLTVLLFLIKEQYTELAKWLCSGGLKNLFR